MTGRGRRTAICAVLLAAGWALVGGPTPAAAAWEQVPAPSGGIRSLSAASADAIIVSPISSPCCPTFSVTADRGASWSAVQLGGFNIATILGAAPDGSFRVLASHIGGPSLQQFQVFKVQASGGVEPIGPAIPTDSGSFSERTAVLDDDGSAWVWFYDEATDEHKVEIVAADGASVTRALPSIGADSWYLFDSVFGPRAMAVGGAGQPSWAPRRGTYGLGAGGSIEAAEPYPVQLADGDFRYAPYFERASWDAGLHWAEVFDPAAVVPRVLGQARFFVLDGAIAERHSPSLYRAAGSPLPAGALSYTAIDAGDALVVHSETAIYVEPLPLGSAPTTIGPVPADSAALISRADLFRADAGLPPLTGDAAISQAAFNHSRYTALNETEFSLSAHYEIPGMPGFTGSGLGERCEAVGALCRGEVMYAPVPDPVGGWLATVFHRFVPGGPEVGLIGGGKADGGWFVMDAGADRNVLIQPFGYPVGRWRGADGFYGEIPDPVEICNENGQPISYPVGVAVTLSLPLAAGTVERILVRKQGAAIPLAGCWMAGSGAFIPDDPLERGQSYDVHAEWRTTPSLEADGTTTQGILLSHDWSFFFEPDFYGKEIEKRPCVALGLRTIRSVAKARRGGRSGQVLGIEEQVKLKQPAKVRLKWAQLNYWVAGKRHSVGLPLGKLRRHPVRVGRTSFLRFRLPARVVPLVIPGEPAELRLKFTGRRVKSCRRTVHIGRIRKVKIGWVRVEGPAGWGSGKALGRR